MKRMAWGMTHPGRKREHNEDSLLISPALGLYAVADGMGGHTGGDRASRMAVELLEHEIELSEAEEPTLALVREPRAEEAAVRMLREAARRTSRAIYEYSRHDASTAGMGTTLTAMLVRGDRLHVAHVGDSRCYRFRGDVLEQVTQDHSWTQAQVSAGVMTADEARGSALKHVITRSVGFEADVEVDIRSLEADPDDRYLLCTDGLYNCITQADLREQLMDDDGAEIPRRLIDAANRTGGDDNITVLLVRFG